MPVSTNTLPLPTLNAAPVSAEARLAYVLRHFRRAYPDAPNVDIGYAGSQPAITVANGAGSFFQQHTPYPAAPNYRDWAGQRIPFFFDSQPADQLLSTSPGRAKIGADIISAAFYLLSGWQEYFSDVRDRHGRFPYAASVQKQYGFVDLPVVNYYFDVLKTAVEHVTGETLQPRRWGQDAPFAAFITHDIDNLRSGWKAPAKAALKQKHLLKFGRLLWQHFTKPDTWDNLEMVSAATAAYGAKSTFFILPASQSGADGTPNADYQLEAALWDRLYQLSENVQSEIALHGSIGTAVSEAQFGGEVASFLMARSLFPFGNRFHYLRWEPRLNTTGIRNWN